MSLQTSVIVGRVLDGGGEDADLAEEHRDQQRGAGGVGGGGQEVRDPGGQREHRGGDEVDKEVLPVAADHVNLDSHDGVVTIMVPGLLDSVLERNVREIIQRAHPNINLSIEIADIDSVTSNFVSIQNLLTVEISTPRQLKRKF